MQGDHLNIQPAAVKFAGAPGDALVDAVDDALYDEGLRDVAAYEEELRERADKLRLSALTDTEIDTLITNVGLTRIWAAVERTTSPSKAVTG